MNRRQLTFVILVNALISTVIALAVAFAVDARRPDAEELAALYTPVAPALIVTTPAANSGLVPTFTPIPPGGALPVSTPLAGDAPAPVQDGEIYREIYVVESGDSLLGIAGRFGVTLDALMQANQLTNPDFVFVGQRLRIPVGGADAAAPSDDTASGAASGDAVATAPVSADGVIVSAVSGVGDSATEQILIVNDSDQAFNLQGWTLELIGASNLSPFTFGTLSLFPGGSVRINSRSGVDTSVDLYWGQADPLLASGTTVRLTDSNGVVVNTYVVP